MIELVVLEYLKSALEVPVFMEKPTDETTFVLIEKTGSGVENYINEATFAVQSYAESLYDAAVLNEKVKKAMKALPVFEDVSRCALNSDYNFTDTTTKEYRYQSVYDLVY